MNVDRWFAIAEDAIYGICLVTCAAAVVIVFPLCIILASLGIISW